MISSIPVELANLPVLSYLALCDNRIQSIPPQFTRYTHAYLFDFFSTVHSERHLVNRVVCAHHVFFFLFLLCHSSSSVFLLFPTHSLSTFSLSLLSVSLFLSQFLFLSLSPSLSVYFCFSLLLSLCLTLSVSHSLSSFLPSLSISFSRSVPLSMLNVSILFPVSQCLALCHSLSLPVSFCFSLSVFCCFPLPLSPPISRSLSPASVPLCQSASLFFLSSSLSLSLSLFSNRFYRHDLMELQYCY